MNTLCTYYCSNWNKSHRIDFCSNFVHWIFITWFFREMPMPIKARTSEALKISHFGIVWCSLEERIPSNNCNESLRLMTTHIKLNAILVSDTNKHFKFDLDRKLNPWLTFEPNSKDHSVSTFFLIIQFSETEIRLVFSRLKLWAERMRDANVRNDSLNWPQLSFCYSNNLWEPLPHFIKDCCLKWFIVQFYEIIIIFNNNNNNNNNNSLIFVERKFHLHMVICA